MNKLHRVVMLPTEKAKRLDYLLKGKDIHLYFTSDDEIKEDGIWFISNGKLHQSGYNERGDYQVVVATTDSSIAFQNCSYCMQGGVEWSTMDICQTCNGSKKEQVFGLIHESFIKAYVKAEGKIDEVMLEMKQDHDRHYDWSPENTDRVDLIWYPKLREDGTCIVHEAKMYTRAEVIELCRDAHVNQKNQTNDVL